MSLKIEKGVLTVDVLELIEHLDHETRQRLAKYLAFDEHLISAVVSLLVKGEWPQDEEPWYFGEKFAAELREKLLPLVPDIFKELIRDLIQQRLQAKLDQERWQEWAWALYHANYIEGRDTPRQDSGYAFVYRDGKEVRALMAQLLPKGETNEKESTTQDIPF